MIQLFKTRFIICVSVLCFACTFIVTASAQVQPEQEPNNTISTATLVEPNKPFTITINPEGDIDWFKINVPSRGYLNLLSKNIPDNLGTEVKFAIYDEWESENPLEIRKWHRLNDACFIPEAGTYFFAIKDDSDDEYSEQPIMLMPKILGNFDEYEPNNSLKDAVEINDGDIIKIAIFPIEDKDCFKIKTKEQGYLTLKIKNDLTEISPEVRYSTYDEWSEPQQTVIRSWKRLPDACPVLPGKEYYIEIKDSFDDNAETTVFDIKTDLIKEMDEFEPNNSFESAKLITGKNIISTAIFPLEDIDIFTIDSGTSDIIKFSIRNTPEEITPEMKLYKYTDEFTEPEEASGWKSLPCSFQVEPQNKYYICLHDNSDDYSSMTVFDIKIEGNGSMPTDPAFREEISKETDSEAKEEIQDPELVNSNLNEKTENNTSDEMVSEEIQTQLEARKKQRDDMIKLRQERQKREAEMRKKQAEIEKKRREVMKKMSQ